MEIFWRLNAVNSSKQSLPNNIEGWIPIGGLAGQSGCPTYPIGLSTPQIGRGEVVHTSTGTNLKGASNKSLGPAFLFSSWYSSSCRAYTILLRIEFAKIYRIPI